MREIAGMPIVAAEAGPVPDWWEGSARAFTENLSRPGYPCHFGAAALARGELHTTFFDRDVEPLARAVRAFLELAVPHPRHRMVLAAFRRPDERACEEAEYAEQFWSILQGLRDLDESPWPADVPHDVTHPRWEFCFAEVPMFVFSAAPTYERRRSRNLGPGLVLLFQPRTVFTGIEGGTPGGTQARRRIRERLAKWDTAPVHPDIGDYGDPANREWLQYFLPDGEGRLREQCPLHLAREDLRTV